MNNKLFQELDKLYKVSSVIPVTKKDKIVIFSDLHMGEGGKHDDFISNSSLFFYALKHYYLERNYKLILNGDVEELQRYSYNAIYQRWKKVYHMFDNFAIDDKLIKIIGNHDIGLLSNENISYPYPVTESVNLDFRNQNIFVFHGHQASRKYNFQNAMIGYTLRYFANPLGIKNYSVSHNSRKKYRIEKNVYDFSSVKKIMSVIGHTHRPLFESLPKLERIKYRLEQLMREYSAKDLKKDKRIEQVVSIYKNELSKLYEKKSHKKNPNIYNSMIHVPVLFNSGCVIGKRGMTCLEIVNGKIRLIHWFDKKISKKYLNHTGYEPQQMNDSDFFRLIINKERMNYLFARINLLS